MHPLGMGADPGGTNNHKLIIFENGIRDTYLINANTTFSKLNSTIFQFCFFLPIYPRWSLLKSHNLLHFPDHVSQIPSLCNGSRERNQHNFLKLERLKVGFIFTFPHATQKDDERQFFLVTVVMLMDGLLGLKVNTWSRPALCEMCPETSFCCDCYTTFQGDNFGMYHLWKLLPDTWLIQLSPVPPQSGAFVWMWM